MKTFGQLLLERREALGWRPETLAFHAGMSAQQIRNIETGRTSKPHAATIKQLEQALARGRAARMRTRSA